VNKKKCIPTSDRETTRNILKIYDQYHRPEFIGIDPLVTVRKFENRADREIGGFVAASLSYGRVETIIRSIDDLFARMGCSPAEFAVSTRYAEKCRLFRGFKHRFNDGNDMARLLQALGDCAAEHGSIGSLFKMRFDDAAGDMRGALIGFGDSIRQKAGSVPGTAGAGFPFLLPSPATGCACKRMVMYLRWMVRRDDGIDLGVWNALPASALIIPVDTHIAAIARTFRMTDRKAADWRMAEEITACLRRIDPFDPVRFDFSLCRSGMVRLRKDAA
jgi:uncharacterized protein (TIGR02757 family)